MALAVVGTLGSALYVGSMSRRPRENLPLEEAPGPANINVDPKPRTKAKQTRALRPTSDEFEQRIRYRFGDPALLEQALTHISALPGLRNRGRSY